MPDPKSRTQHVYLALGAAFLLFAGGTVAWFLAHQGVRAPLRILLIAPATEAESGLEPLQGRALNALVQDHLEYQAGFAVTNLAKMPTDFEPLRGQARTLLVQTQPRRRGQDLELSYRFIWGKQLTKGAPVDWKVSVASVLPPRQAFDAFLATFPQAIAQPFGGLAPRQPHVFWDLLQASAWRLQNQHMADALALAEQTTRQEPDCASTWILLGNLRYRWMLDNRTAFRQDQADAEATLQQGLTLAPGHPRGIFLLSLLKTDIGNQREALDLLLQARHKQPYNPTLLTGIAYAARGVGLLPLAKRAIDLRDQLAFASLQTQAVDITYLYSGEIARFEANLQEQPGHLRSTSGVLPFYRGYLALVRGNHALAHKEFQTAAALSNGYPNILRLSEIFDLIIQGQKEAAWKKLRAYDLERVGMREPDGEFTIRLAEAYALMGDRASAMDMASRAFARGFGCTAWYEQSPMLEPLRTLPKWKALIQHLKDRQVLMEERFPVSVLEEN